MKRLVIAFLIGLVVHEVVDITLETIMARWEHNLKMKAMGF